MAWKFTKAFEDRQTYVNKESIIEQRTEVQRISHCFVER